MTTIKEAAIWFEGKVYTGKRHNEIIKEMVERHNIKPPVSGHQGFVTEDGHFVSREAGAKIAFEAGQIKKPTTTLFSEDLY
jgi:hypothetical protein